MRESIVKYDSSRYSALSDEYDHIFINSSRLYREVNADPMARRACGPALHLRILGPLRARPVHKIKKAWQALEVHGQATASEHSGPFPDSD